MFPESPTLIYSLTRNSQPQNRLEPSQRRCCIAISLRGVAIGRGKMVLTKLLLPILLLLIQTAPSEAGQDGWDKIITGLAEFDGPAFRDEVAEPLVQMSANAYRCPEVIDVPRWILSSKVALVAPAGGGMHAVVYEEESGGAQGRIVVAFRGIQIGATTDCDADMCADELLWTLPGGDNCSLPLGTCDKFDEATLDYFSQAVEYTRKVIAAYPSASLLLTGHSLGAGLAVLVSAALSTHPAIPVIGFSSAGTRNALKVRNLTLDADHQKRIIIIADQWDEIMRTSWDQQLGLLCFYQTALDSNCKKCFESPSCIFGTVSSRRRLVEIESVTDADDCMLCFLKTHYLANVMNTIQKGTRPVCEYVA
ncbi:uncharacterized protein [Physcomitrium patens]|uniref:Fungal lipase-type domain-containing protein n=1 Tax=Physcomitrium patens TaxID=3218 RepID=A0A7I4D9E2_PHYPA|nr:uncharacterized protein LOC112279512 [Physcomitrium patens]|eukprot:XP_024369794.1 uncharacterized protein LOC112279512 [Physcomitrella patens]